MGLFKFICAIFTRFLFILVSLLGVWRVTSKKDDNYWLLTFLFLPLVVEMIITLKSRKGQDYKWFSPPVFLFLISIIPSIWILELHHQQDKASDPQCNKLDSWENVRKVITLNETVGSLTYKNYLKETYLGRRYLDSFPDGQYGVNAEEKNINIRGLEIRMQPQGLKNSERDKESFHKYRPGFSSSSLMETVRRSKESVNCANNRIVEGSKEF